jgi:hypothetical protein
MIKVIDPDGNIIGVFYSHDDIPEKLPNRMQTYWYPTKECDIVEVTDPNDQARLAKSLPEKTDG